MCEILFFIIGCQIHASFMVFISYRIDFTSDKKSLGAGKKRTITFNQGDSEQEQIEAKGMLKGDLSVAVSKGLPNTSSKNC